MTEIQGALPPDDISITKPVSSTPSSSSQQLPSAKTLRSWAPLYLKHTDATISHLNRILSSPSGTDSLLCTLQYSTLATSTLLSALSLRRLHSQVLQLLSSARALPAHTTILITPSSSSSVSTILSPPLLLRLSQSLKALSALISDFRIFVRLWGLLAIYRWARGLLAGATAVQDPPGRDRVLQGVAWAQIVVNVAFQVLENGAYLASKGVLLGWDARRQARAWLWSSRFWAAHVGLEFMRLAYLWSESGKRRRAAAGQEKEKEELVLLGGEEGEQAVAWKRDLVCNAAYAPLTVHWSLEGGIMGDFWVGLLGTVAGGVGFAQVWKNTA